ncbi:MAG: O-methyltransferase [Defluviitaleaceae bacterium]|nr:O-methyltransferase [Defluviitaleaceae bacterium]
MLIDKQLQGYLDGLLPEVGGLLGQIQRRAYDEGLPVVSDHAVALLSVLLVAKRPTAVLEIGCGVGFSAALFARFLAPGGRVTTIERYDYMAGRAKENFAKLGIVDKIRLVEDDADRALPKLAADGECFDFIFMDCCKSRYISYLPYCVEMLMPGGLLVVDDVLQSGTVAWDFDKIVKRNRTTYRNMREFLETAMGVQGCFASIVPIGDGMLLCVKGDTGIE